MKMKFYKTLINLRFSIFNDGDVHCFQIKYLLLNKITYMYRHKLYSLKGIVNILFILVVTSYKKSLGALKWGLKYFFTKF